MTKFIRVNQGPGDRVSHNSRCGKLRQKNVPPGAYRAVAKAPRGYRPCERCGG